MRSDRHDHERDAELGLASGRAVEPHRRAAQGQGRAGQGDAAAAQGPRQAGGLVSQVLVGEQEAAHGEEHAGEEAGAAEVHGESTAARSVRHAEAGRHLCRELGGRLRVQ